MIDAPCDMAPLPTIPAEYQIIVKDLEAGYAARIASNLRDVLAPGPDECEMAG